MESTGLSIITSLSILPLAFMGACAASGGQTMGGESDAMGNGAFVGSVEILEENLVDNLEDGNDEIIETTDRSGSWYTYNDGSKDGAQMPSADGAFSPSEGGPEGSKFVARTIGSGFTDWGAGMGLDLNGADAEGATKGVFDASALSGIAFVGKGNATITVNVVIVEVLSKELGGLCDTEDGAGDCDDTHRVTIELSEEWTQYVIPFDRVIQTGWGRSVLFDKSTLVSIHFTVADMQTFEFFVDDLGFYADE